MAGARSAIEALLGSLTMRRVFGLYLVWGACIGLLLSSCYTPPPIPVIRTPIPVALDALLLNADDLPTFERDSKWSPTKPFDVLEQWEWTNAVAATEAWFTYGAYTSFTYTIAQYGDSAGAQSTWREYRDAAVVPELSGEEVAVLSAEKGPPLHADNVSIRCERYGDETNVPQRPSCIARLQYDVLYVQFRTQISEDLFSPKNFYDILQVVDERMHPIWEGRDPTPDKSLQTPMIEITPSVVESETIEALLPTQSY